MPTNNRSRSKSASRSKTVTKAKPVAPKTKKTVTSKKDVAPRATTPSKKVSKKTGHKRSAQKPEVSLGNIVQDTPVTKTKSKSVSKSQPKGSDKKAGNHRNFFTVAEDNTILEFLTRNSELKMTAISKIMAQKLNRSTESVRDRIKKYLSKISEKDVKLIATAAKVIY